uniref:Peroxisomal membrane protein PEX16 n=1 Tax=Alexandrium catenella TaxID=2925 RepID=A0A7S1RYS8_ALECA
MLRCGGVVPVLAFASSIARVLAEVSPLPDQEVQPSVDPVTFAVYLEPRQRRLRASPLRPLADMSPGESAGWLMRALMYGTVVDLLLVRFVLQRLLGAHLRPDGRKAPAPASSQAQPAQPAAPAEHHEQPSRREQQGSAELGAAGAEGGHSRVFYAAAAALLGSVVSVGVHRATSRRRRPVGVVVVPAAEAKASGSRSCVTQLPHGLVQRRLQNDAASAARSASKGTVRHVSWRSTGMSPVPEEGTSSQPATQFYRICSEAPPPDFADY